jgi:CubicO group peptidase (beta-lactamase class C family)
MDVRTPLDATPDGAIDASLSRTSRVLEQLAAANPQAGFQLAVLRDGRVLCDDAAGMATATAEAEPSSLFPWFCCSKLCGIVVLARALEANGLDFDARVAELLPPFGAAGKETVTLRDLGTYVAPFATIGTSIDRPEPVSDRPAAGARRLRVESLPGPLALRRICEEPLAAPPGSYVVYTGFSAWHVFAAVVERLTSVDYFELARVLADDLGIAQELAPVVDEALARGSDGRLADMLRVRRSGRIADYPFDPEYRLRSAGTGARGSARAMARLLSALRRDATDPARRGGEACSWSFARAIVGTQREGLRDPLFDGRRTRWGLGVCTEPDVLGAPADAHAAIALANEGAFGLLDLTHGVIVAFTTNLLLPGEYDLARKRRIVRAVYRDLELLD